MKVAQFVANYVASISPRVYGVCGAGAMHLNDALATHPGINVISMQHEQAATMAAECDARVTGEIGVVSVTAGPGGSNTVTGLACAYVDSIPLLVIAGQVTSRTMIRANRVRQLGMNELDMIGIVEPITKCAVTVRDPQQIRYLLERAVHIATHGRKGPVWVEIPLDVQAAEVNPDKLPGFDPNEFPKVDDGGEYMRRKIGAVAKMLAEARRPVIIVGNGVRLAGACDKFNVLVDKLQVPVISSWGASDVIDNDSGLYLGRCGLFGDRPGNFAIQAADLVIAIGTRLSVAQIGHASDLFAPKARKVIVDIDPQEVHKPTVKADVSIVADAGAFIDAALGYLAPFTSALWLTQCRKWKRDYPPTTGKFLGGTEKINSYRFVDQLASHLDKNAVVLTDVGFCFIPTMQALRVKPGQRLIHSAGVSPMGWAIPASVGAALAGNGRQVVCLTGDGGAMMNLQELQTIAHLQLPVTIFVYENNGYATMKIAQQTHFKREVMAGPKSGMTLPDFGKIARAFGIYTMELGSNNALEFALGSILDIGSQGPIVVVMHMDPDQVIEPRVQARIENGKFVPASLEDMWPYLKKEMQPN